MRRLFVALSLLVLLWINGDARPGQTQMNSMTGASIQVNAKRVVRVRLWYLHPPRNLRLRAEGYARVRKCTTCEEVPLTAVSLHASGSRIELDGDQAATTELNASGSYTLTAPDGPPISADFPITVQASEGHLTVTARMPLEKYIATVLAGEVGNFKSDEALKAMAVAARTFALHFGTRHAPEGFDFCDTTHCQNLRVASLDQRLRTIAESTAGEVLLYDGELAATYYHANCGGTTEDGHYILGKDDPPAPFLRQHADPYCVRSGDSQWRTEVSKRELQRALAADGVRVGSSIRAVSVLQRTPSGRVEDLRINGITVSALPFRFAIGHHIGWDHLKSNWYSVSNSSTRLVFRGRGYGHGVGLCQVGAEMMGEEGHDYREILAFYYPGTALSPKSIAESGWTANSSSAPIPAPAAIASGNNSWRLLAGDHVELLTTRPDQDRSLLSDAERIAQEMEESTGLKFRSKPQLKSYLTVMEFRNSTGEPAYIAAATRGRVIHLQPSEVLRNAGTLDDTLRHELMHMLLESYARSGTPVWFREGLTLFLTSPAEPADSSATSVSVLSLERSLRHPASEDELRRAYAAAQARVAALVRDYGKTTLIEWLQNGLPPAAAEQGPDQSSAPE